MNVKKNASVRLPPEVLEWYKSKAKENNQSISSICGYALIKYYEENLKNQDQKNERKEGKRD